jgi:predicted metal-dependent phosphoesterase TrpH
VIDLHVHTTASDGTTDPAAVVEMAVTLRLTAVAITDHDSVGGVRPAIDAARGRIEVVPGIELSATYAGRDFHVLGYFIDHTDPSLLARLSVLQRDRLDRASRMVDALAATGNRITLEGVLLHANEGAVGRSHVARALVEAGAVEDVEEAFARLIGRDGACYVEKPVVAVDEACRIIRAAGGVPLLAHPGVSRADDCIGPLVEMGLAGIEAYHAEHDRSRRAHYARLAERLGIAVSGGSDYHGPTAKGSRLGAGDTPPGSLERLRALAAGA